MTGVATTTLLSSRVWDALLSDDGSRLFVTTGPWPSSTNTVAVVNTQTGEIEAQYEFDGRVNAIDISGDGLYIVVALSEGLYGDTASFARIEIATGTVETFVFGTDSSHNGFTDIAWLSDGTVLLSHERSGPLRQFDFDTGLFTSIDADHLLNSTFVTSQDDGEVLIITRSATQTSHVFTVGEGITATDTRFPDPYAGASLPSPLTPWAAISPDGQTIVHQGRLYDANLTPIGSLGGSFTGFLRGYTFSPDGTRLYAIERSGLVVEFDMGTLEPIAVYDAGQEAASEITTGSLIQISADGSHLSVIGETGVQLVDLALVTSTATSGADILTNGETLIGLDGDDVLGGAGYQFMFGGRGDDTYYFDGYDERAVEREGEGYDIVYTNVSASSGDYVEELIFTGTGNARLSGGLGSQTIVGGNGNDIFDGREGDDTLIGSLGDDTYFVYDAGDVVIELADEGFDTVRTVLSSYTLPDNIERVYASAQADLIGNELSNTMVGSYYDDRITALAGDDTVNGGAGDDLLFGNEGDDILRGDTGMDRLTGGLGADQLIGGGGSDTIIYEDADGAVTIDLVSGIGSGSQAEGDTFIAIENVLASAFNDTLVGNYLANRLEGASGDDRIVASAGSDVLDGGRGVDTADYSSAPRSIYLNLLTGSAAGWGADTLVSIEHVVGSAFADTLVGSIWNNKLWGENGNDNLRGGGGNDRLFGGIGWDVLEGGSDNDLIDGGNGRDTASYAGAASRVNVDLALQGSAQDTLGAGVDTLFNIENLLGSAFNDRLRGDDAKNDLFGGDGDDILHGYGGNDLLIGGNGEDRLFGFEGWDVMRGDAGDDVMDGGNGSDLLKGNDGADDLWGADGDDRIYGGNGEDLVYGNEGDDRIWGQGGADELRGGAGADVIHGNNGNDYILGHDDNDILYGDSGNDFIDGGAGDDVILGGFGKDFLNGDTGADRFVFGENETSRWEGAADTIIDFSGSQLEGDTIDLSAIDADSNTADDDAFSFIGTAAFSGTAGELRTYSNGGDTFLAGDVDGDGAADFFLRLQGSVELTAADFML